MVVRKSSRVLRATALGGGFLFLSHAGCLDNLDELSREYGAAGSTSGNAGTGKGGSSNAEGGTSAGGTAGDSGGQGGEPGAGEAGASNESGGSAGGAGIGEGAASGTAGVGASGEGGVGGTSGAAGSSGSSGSGGSDGGQAGSFDGRGGEGGLSCDDGLVICPGSAGCVDLDVGTPEGEGVTDCGVCGETCSLENASAAECEVRRCSPTCLTGFGDCNAEAADDGCETAITTIANCGDCGYVCSSIGATSVECPVGRCEPACAVPFGDCNSDQALALDDGCETKLDVLTACRESCTDDTPTSCAAAEVCNAGVCGAPEGVVQFSVPITMSGQNQRYADLFEPPANLTGALVTVRLYAPGATGGSLQIYFTDSSEFTPGGFASASLADLSQRWTDVTLSVTGGADFDTTMVRQLNLEVISGSSTAWTDPTIIYVDSIRSTNLAVNHGYDTTQAPMVMSGSQVIAGSTITWLSAMP